MNNDEKKTYDIENLFDSLKALVEQYPLLGVAAPVEVVAELAEGAYPVPGDLLDIVSIKFNPTTGCVHLKVAEKD